MSEQSDVTRPILEALARIPGVVAWRCNAGGYRGRMVGAPKGTPDIIGFMRVGQQEMRTTEDRTGLVTHYSWFARFFGIECKKAGGRTGKPQKIAQEAWGKRLVDHGGLYVVARTVAEALQGLGIGAAS